MRGFTVEAGRALFIAGVMALALLAGCGGNSAAISRALPDADAVADNPAEALSPATATELQARLDAELSRLAIDPKRAATAPGAGNAVFDLQAQVIDPDGAGPLPMTGVELSWTERCLGDYDQNGEVNAGDLTPLGQRLGSLVEYLEPGAAGGLEWWPQGAPEDGGAAEAPAPPEAGSAAQNWRLARIDGNFDGELNLGDITPIAAHWHERLDGYRVYRKGPQDAQFLLLPNTAQSDDPWLTVPRSTTYMPGADHPDPQRPVRYSYVDQVSDFGPYEYYVVAFDTGSDAEGSHSASGTARSNRQPLAALQLDPPGGVAPLEVTLDASASVDPDGSVVSYLWDFEGDGFWDLDSGSDPVVQHTYTAAQVFQPTVRVRDDAGAEAEASAALSTTGAPVAQLTATPSEGPAPLRVTLDASASFDPEGTVAEYAWDFDGDGSLDFDSANDPIIEHTYSGGVYHTRVQVRDGENLAGTAEVILRVGSPPVAYMTANPEYGNIPLAVHFDAGASLDPDGAIVEYKWILEGSSGSEVRTGAETETDVTYHKSGEQLVILRVTDNSGLKDTYALRVHVNQAPIAEIRSARFTGAPPFAAEFNAEESYDEDGVIEYYHWDVLDDGVIDAITTQPQFSHTFTATGWYQVRLTVVDDLGATANAATTVLANSPPQAVLAPQMSIGAAPRTVVFDTSASSDSDGTIVSHSWAVYSSQESISKYYNTGADPHLSLSLEDINCAVFVHVWLQDDLGGSAEAVAYAYAFAWDAVDLHQALDPGLGFTGLANYFLLNTGGRPALLYVNGNGGLEYARATDAAGSSWGALQALPQVGNIRSNGLQLASGVPSIGSLESVGDHYEWGFYRATSVEGDSWVRSQAVPEFDPAVDSLAGVLTLAGSRPCMLYQSGPNNNLFYAEATDDDGSTWGAARALPVAGEPVGVTQIGGLPHVFYIDLDNQSFYFNLMQIQLLDATQNTWAEPQVVSSNRSSRLQGPELSAGCPSFIIDGEDGLLFLRAADTEATSWMQPQTIATGYLFCYSIIAGKPAVAFTQTGRLYYTVATDEEGSSWDAPVQIAQAAYQTYEAYLLDLVDVGGKAAVLVDFDNHPFYITQP